MEPLLSTWALHTTLWTVYKGNQEPLPCEAKHASAYLSCQVSLPAQEGSFGVLWALGNSCVAGGEFFVVFLKR